MQKDEANTTAAVGDNPCGMMSDSQMCDRSRAECVWCTEACFSKKEAKQLPPDLKCDRPY
jgi:hypothetical protein